MRRAISVVLGVLLVISMAATSRAAITKALFSEASGSIGLQVTQSESDPDLFQLTFVNHPIDGAALEGVPGPDDSIGWDVLFGPLVVDRTTRAVDGGFATYSLIVPPNGDTLAVQDGLTTRLEADVGVGLLFTKIGGNFGGMDAFGGLTNVSVTPGTSAVFQEFDDFVDAEGFLDWGFAYSGLDLDDYLQNPPDVSGIAASSGYIQTPEPATLGLLGLGFGALLFVRRPR